MAKYMRAIWRYIETHHEQYGVALFVVPALLAAVALISLAYGLAWLFG